MQAELRKLIKKYGEHDHFDGTKEVCKVTCQGCGKTIYSSDDDEIDCSISTRKSANFWHRGCYEKVWDSKLK